MSIWVKCMYVYGVWMCVREFWSFHALYGAANALYWKCLKRQNSTYLTLLKHQNTKTSLYKLSKNHWVITLLESFGSVRRELQSTVSLDHPVVNNGDIVHVGAQVRIATFLRNVWVRPVGWVGGPPTGGILPLGSATQAALKAPGHSRPNAVKDFVRNKALLGLLPDFCSSHLPLLCWACQQCDL